MLHYGRVLWIHSIDCLKNTLQIISVGEWVTLFWWKRLFEFEMSSFVDYMGVQEFGNVYYGFDIVFMNVSRTSKNVVFHEEGLSQTVRGLICKLSARAPFW